MGPRWSDATARAGYAMTTTTTLAAFATIVADFGDMVAEVRESPKTALGVLSGEEARGCCTKVGGGTINPPGDGAENPLVGFLCFFLLCMFDADVTKLVFDMFLDIDAARNAVRVLNGTSSKTSAVRTCKCSRQTPVAPLYAKMDNAFHKPESSELVSLKHDAKLD